MLSGCSALVFVLSFTFEFLDANRSSLERLAMLLALILVLSLVALTAYSIIAHRHAHRISKTLIALILGQVLLVALRAAFLGDEPRFVQVQSLLGAPPFDHWYYLFLIPDILLFISIQGRIITMIAANMQTSTAQVEKQMLQTLNAMAMARDNETGKHILRTQRYVQLIARRLRQMRLHTTLLTDHYIDVLFNAAPLHDVGKVGIPDQILHKDGPLSAEEWDIMKSHTQIGESILSAAIDKLGKSSPVITRAIEIAGAHHERWDGTGYPRGLEKHNIPLSARIMALADMYDALVSKRAYKHGWTHDEAVAEITRISGSHLDPDVVDAFITEQSAFQEIALSMQD